MIKENQIPDVFSDKWFKLIGEKIADLGIENKGDLERAWLAGTKQKIIVSITIGETRPPKVRIQMKSTLSKMDVEVELRPEQQKLDGI